MTKQRSWESPNILNIGHRGASGHAPENTIAAFLEAERLGADGVELDVMLCASGEVVVTHDHELTRLAKAPLRVEDLSLEALRLLDVGAWFAPTFVGERIPTLQEVFDAIPNLLVNVEIKVESITSDFRLLCERVAAIVTQQPRERVVVSSFHPGVLFWYKRLAPQTRLGYLHSSHENIVFRSGLLADLLQPFAMHPGKDLLSETYMKKAKAKHRKVNTWTINELADIEQAKSLGVNGIISNYPERVRDVLRR
jgi:glycerophosphoryl diester phosphodiesterase